jgi:hypothetical protein
LAYWVNAISTAEAIANGITKGRQGATTVTAVRGRAVLPTPTDRPTEHQQAARREQQMRGAQQRLDIDLEAEHRVPGEIEHPADREQQATEKRHPIRAWEHVADRDATRRAGHRHNARTTRNDAAPRYRNACQGVKKVSYDAAVRVRPEIDVEAAESARPTRRSAPSPCGARSRAGRR